MGKVYRNRHTDELVEMIHFNGGTERSESDYVRFIDMDGNERMERLNLHWDFTEADSDELMFITRAKQRFAEIALGKLMEKSTLPNPNEKTMSTYLTMVAKARMMAELMTDALYGDDDDDDDDDEDDEDDSVFGAN